MSVASVAAREKAPIILTDGKKMDDEINKDAYHYIVGGGSIMSEQIVDYVSENVNDLKYDIISGANRYETNRYVLEKFYKDFMKDRATLVQVGGVQDSIINQIFS